jgi:hypothetical protein
MIILQKRKYTHTSRFPRQFDFRPSSIGIGLFFLLLAATCSKTLSAQNLNWPMENQSIETARMENSVWSGLTNAPQPSMVLGSAWHVSHFDQAAEAAAPDSGPSADAESQRNFGGHWLSVGGAASSSEKPLSLLQSPDEIQSSDSQTAPPKQTEIVTGIPSQALQFAAWAKAAGDFLEKQIHPANWLAWQLRPASSLTSVPLPAQSSAKVQLATWVSMQGAADRNATLFQVDSFANDMVTDDTVKDALGGQSGFFSRARWGLNYDYWRVESGVGIAWTTLLDRSKTLVELGGRENIVWNLSVLYFPLGEIPWRPFVLLGTGLSQLNTFGTNTQGNTTTLYTGISHRN